MSLPLVRGSPAGGVMAFGMAPGGIGLSAHHQHVPHRPAIPPASAPTAAAAASPEPLLAGMSNLLNLMMAGGGGGQPPSSTSSSSSPGDAGVLNMIQGVMGHVVNAMTGGSSELTVAEFLNSLPDYNYSPGESLVTDLLMTLAQNITFQEMVALIGSGRGPGSSLQAPLQRFISQQILQGADPTPDNVKAAVLRLADDWYPQLEEAAQCVSVREGVHYPETVHSFLVSRLVDLIRLVQDTPPDTFQDRLGPEVRQIAAEGTALSLSSFTDGQASLERLVENRLAAMTTDVGPVVQQWTTGSAISYLRTFVAGGQIRPDQLVRYLVTTEEAPARAAARAARLAARGAAAAAASAPETSETAATAAARGEAAADSGDGEETFLTPRAGSPDSPALMEVDQHFEQSEPVEEDVTMVPVSVIPVIPSEAAAAAVPAVFPASLLPASLATGVEQEEVDPEGWHGAVPPTWVPIIARDVRQAAPRPTPFSDAYMSGQPSKRRKLSKEKKPRGEVTDVIADSLQEALVATGVEPVGGAERLVSAATGSSVLQSAVEEVTRGAIQERVEKDTDFNPEQFPSAKRFIKKNN